MPEDIKVEEQAKVEDQKTEAPTFTQAELEAKIAAEIEKVTKPLKDELAQAKKFTPTEKATAILKESYMLAYKMPESVAKVAAKLDDDDRAAYIADWQKATSSGSLASAEAKLKPSAADQKVVNLGNGGGAPRGISDKEYIQKSADGEIPMDAKRTKAILDGMGVKV